MTALCVATLVIAVGATHPSFLAQVTTPLRAVAAAPTADAVGSIDEADGGLPSGATVLDDRYSAVRRLDAALLTALRAASRAAAEDGVEIDLNSGWRSAAYQNDLLRQAVATYGSTEEAARWVATVETSPHVSGHAVDVGPTGATVWLASHGAAFGLCQIYRNEPWHYEFRTAATRKGCPRQYADPTQDPRIAR